MNTTTTPYAKAVIFFLAISLVAMAMTSCGPQRPLGACYENGFVGYGHTPRMISGGRR